MVRPAEDPVAEKERIRTETLAARARRGTAERTDAGLEIAGHGIDRWLNSSLVAAYLSVDTEPATRPLLHALATVGVRVVVPVVVGSDLDWVDYLPGGDIATGALGVDEPIGPRLGAAVLASADVILVPALAVDRSGNRLGRGRGYYDRALAGVTQPVVAVVYDEELVESVPIESHDHRAQGILRPAGYVPV